MKSRAGGAAKAAPRAAAANARGWWKHPALWTAFVALLLHLPVLGGGFVRDDRELFADNRFMRLPGYLTQLLTTDFWSSAGAESGLWRPAVTLSFWLDGRIGGWMPVWYHAVNLLSHVLVTALVALVMVQAGAGVAAAWIAGLWFAVQPAHVEPVAWISGRTDVWGALFALLAVWLHLRAAAASGLAAWIGRGAAVLAFALALLSKEAALPVVVVLAVLLARRLTAVREGEGRRGTAALAIELAPYALLIAAWWIAHQRVAPGALAATPGWRDPSAAERLWTAIAVFPSQLAFFLPGFPHGPDWWIAPARSPADFRVALGALLHAGLAVLIVRTWRSRTPVVPAALLLWLPSLLVAFVTLTRGVLVQGERHVYLASAGAAWLLGLGGWTLWKRGFRPGTAPRAAVAVAGGIVLLAGIVQSATQIRAWRSDETMYRAMTRSQPGRADGYLGLALVSIGQRRDDVALRAIERAEAIDSTRYEAATYRAAIASRRAEWSEVIRWSRNSIRRGATESDPWLMEINALQVMRLLPWSRAMVETLMTRHKDDPDVAAAFGRQMLLEDIPGRAVKPLEYAVGWNPDDPTLRVLLGDAYMKVKLPDKALEQFRTATGLDPSNVDAWVRLATVFHTLGEVGARDDAIRNAASLPGVDRDRLRAIYDRMLAGIPQRTLDSLKAR